MVRFPGWCVKGCLIFILTVFIMMLCGFNFIKHEVKPDQLDETGLVVASFSSNQPLGLASTKNADVKIDGELFKGAIKDHHLLVQLKPGTYKLESLHYSFKGGQYSSSSFNNVNVKLSKVFNMTYTLNVDFEIKAGQVTNIGAVLAFLLDQEGKKGRIFHVRNDADAKWYLKHYHPEILAKLKSAEFLSSSAKYVPVEKVQDLRRLLIRGLPVKEREQEYITAALGTLCRVVKNPDGKVKDLQLIETDTYERIWIRDYRQGRFACAVPDTDHGYRLFMITDGKLEKNILPNFTEQSMLTLVGDQGVVVADPLLSIQVSPDNGATWETYDKAELDQPAVSMFLFSNILSGPVVDVYNGLAGYYIYSRGDDTTLLYRDFKHVRNFRNIAAPENKYNYRGLVETKDGLFTFPNNTEWSTSSFYFLPAGSDQWQKRDCPYRGCTKLTTQQDKIVVQCYDKFWTSADAGATWEEK